MSDAITYFWLIFNNTISLLFNSLYIVQGVTIGWVIVWVAIASFIIKALLNTKISHTKYKGGSNAKENKKGDK